MATPSGARHYRSRPASYRRAGTTRWEMPARPEQLAHPVPQALAVLLAMAMPSSWSTQTFAPSLMRCGNTSEPQRWTIGDPSGRIGLLLPGNSSGSMAPTVSWWLALEPSGAAPPCPGCRRVVLSSNHTVALRFEYLPAGHGSLGAEAKACVRQFASGPCDLTGLCLNDGWSYPGTGPEKSELFLGGCDDADGVETWVQNQSSRGRAGGSTLVSMSSPSDVRECLTATDGSSNDASPSAAYPMPRVVSCAANASAPERYAAQQLVRHLQSSIGNTGAPVKMINATARAAANVPQLAVGYTAARLLGVSAASFSGLGREGYLLLTNAAGTSVALSGGLGAPRGTLYAVNEFLEALGVQFLAADVTVPLLKFPSSLPRKLRPRYVPILEYRQTFGFEFLTSADFAVHLRTNKAHFNEPTPELDSRHGGVYPVFANPPGAAHTSYSLLPGGADRGLEGPPPALWAS
eukprot:SAG31_NODE_7848_length_1583_cov_1.797170_1_plen_462_part_10